MISISNVRHSNQLIIFSLGNRLCFIGENLLPPRLLHRELNFPVPGRNCESQTKRWYDHQTGEIYLSDAINAYAHGRAVYGASHSW